MTRREENQKIFQDTERLCKTNSRLKDSVARATVNQKMIPETLRLPTPDKKRFPEEARILISKKRSFEAAEPYARSGSKVAVHNFASASNPGGGVVNGSGAQEECLCRCSGLYFSLNVPEMWNSFYAPHRAEHNPLHNDDIIYEDTNCFTFRQSCNRYPDSTTQSGACRADAVSDFFYNESGYNRY